jgi:hypothetical protein
MKQLNQKAFERARHFLKTEARPLEWTLFAHRFEAGSVEAVLEALARFQNADGGFGHALEPDVRTPQSSALATGIGLGILRDLNVPATHPMVRRAVTYLLETFDKETMVWRALPEGANAHPHAPWWHDEDGSLARTFDNFVVIPRMQLVGLLHHFAAEVPAEWLETVTQRTLDGYLSLDDVGSGGGDDLAYAIEMAETGALPARIKAPLVERIRESVPEVVERDPAAWDTYCIAPLKLVSSSDSLVYDLLAEDVQANLDYQIAHQTEAGTWEPTWTWSGAYPEAWAEAKREWRGELTLSMLETLEAFDRIKER